MPNTQTGVKWTRSEYIEGRLDSDNGLSILDEKRITVAVDRPSERSEGRWVLRVWGLSNRERLRDPLVMRYESQRRAKAVAAQFLPLTREHRYDSWSAEDELRRIESAICREENAQARAALDAFLADYTPTPYVFGTVTLASGETRKAKRMVLDGGDVLDAVTWYEVNGKMRSASDRIAATWQQED